MRKRQQWRPVRRTSVARFADSFAWRSSFVSFRVWLSCSCLFFRASTSSQTCHSTAVGSLIASDNNTFVRLDNLIFASSGDINPSNYLPHLSFASSTRRIRLAFAISFDVIITSLGGAPLMGGGIGIGGWMYRVTLVS